VPLIWSRNPRNFSDVRGTGGAACVPLATPLEIGSLALFTAPVVGSASNTGEAWRMEGGLVSVTDKPGQASSRLPGYRLPWKRR
jgi:hypothetical protein